MQQTETVESRHHHVRQNKIRPCAPGFRKGLCTVYNCDEFVLWLQNVPNVLAHVRIVIGEKNARARALR